MSWLAEADARFEMHVASLQRKAEERGGGAVYQISGPVGAIVSGAYASATVSQSIGPQDRAELVAVLDRLADAIGRSAEFSEQQQREDLIECVQEVRAELGKGRPNGLRLGSILSGVGDAVRTIASIEPAYQAVKVAVRNLLGFELP